MTRKAGWNWLRAATDLQSHWRSLAISRDNGWMAIRCFDGSCYWLGIGVGTMDSSMEKRHQDTGVWPGVLTRLPSTRQRQL